MEPGSHDPGSFAFWPHAREVCGRHNARGMVVMSATDPAHATCGSHNDCGIVEVSATNGSSGGEPTVGSGAGEGAEVELDDLGIGQQFAP